MSGVPDIFVINLDSAETRWTNMSYHASSDVNLIRFSAIDGSVVQDTYLLSGQTIVRPGTLTYNEFGCLLSHLTLWHNLIMGDYKEVIILEDDVYLPNDFGTRLRGFYKDLPQDYDIAYLTYNTDMHVNIVVRGIGQVTILHDTKNIDKNEFQISKGDPKAYRLLRAYGLPGYLLSKRGALKLFNYIIAKNGTRSSKSEYVMPNGVGRKITWEYSTDPIDLRVLSVLKSINAYIALPMLCLPDHEISSTIGSRGTHSPD
jgi:glycosyl transferase family 25